MCPDREWYSSDEEPVWLAIRCKLSVYSRSCPCHGDPFSHFTIALVGQLNHKDVIENAYCFEPVLSGSNSYPDYDWTTEALKSRSISWQWVRRREVDLLTDHDVDFLAYFHEFDSEEMRQHEVFTGDDAVCSFEDVRVLFETLSSGKPSVFRARGDAHTRYGDGGRSTLFFPVFSTVLPSASLLSRLKESLLDLADERDDSHEFGPVCDIIDPLWKPFRLSSTDSLYDVNCRVVEGRGDSIAYFSKKSMDRNERSLYTKQNLHQFKADLGSSSSESNISGAEGTKEKEKENTCISDAQLFRRRLRKVSQVRAVRHDLRHRFGRTSKQDDKEIIKRDIRHMSRRYEVKFDDYMDEATQLRESVRMIPAEVAVHGDGTTEFLSPIHNLPRVPQNIRLYEDLARLFSYMLPLWKRLGLLRSSNLTNLTRLQVIVKAQCYRMSSQIHRYSGKWHVEGLTEHIVAAGVAYLATGRGLDGGNLEFAPPEAPGDNYGFDRIAHVNVSKGKLAAWSNCMPHRATPILNETGRDLDRVFVNFFIVDPTRPIASTGNCISRSWLVSFLRIITAKLTGGKPLPIEVANEIVDFAVRSGLRFFTRLPWKSDDEARSFRDYYRKVVSSAASGGSFFHNVCYGNCGVTTFCNVAETADTSYTGQEVESNSYIFP